VRLIHDQGKALARQLADLLRDDREFLERRDDDRLARLKRLFVTSAEIRALRSSWRRSVAL